MLAVSPSIRERTEYKKLSEIQKYNKRNAKRAILPLPIKYHTHGYEGRRDARGGIGIMHSLARMNKEKCGSIQLDMQSAREILCSKTLYVSLGQVA